MELYYCAPDTDRNNAIYVHICPDPIDDDPMGGPINSLIRVFKPKRYKYFRQEK